MSRIRIIRQNVFQMTQTEFAKLLGVRQSAISQLEARDALPSRHQQIIRTKAAETGIEWRDEWFFSPPSVPVHREAAA